MIKSHNTYLTLDIEAVIDWHFQILGKDITDAERKLFFQVLVTDNPLFPTNEHIEVVLKAFFSAIHYGNAELKGTNIRSHSILINEWLKHRSTIRPANKPQSNKLSGKPDDWVYDPDEPLPIEITKDKAVYLLNALAAWRGGKLEDWRHKVIQPLPVGSAEGWSHYIGKLKERAKGLR
jgi:hypothetical protein